MSKQSNRLAILDELATSTGRDYRQSGDSYMAAAAGLVKARDLCEHGEWLPWLEKAGIPKRTSQRMMRLARSGIKSAIVAHFGVAHIDDTISELVECLPDGIEPEADHIELVEFVINPVQEIYWWAHGVYTKYSGEADDVESARPSTLTEYLHWREWLFACPGKQDREAFKGWFTSGPWLPGHGAPDEPQPATA